MFHSSVRNLAVLAVLLPFAIRPAQAAVSTFGCGGVPYCTIAQLDAGGYFNVNGVQFANFSYDALSGYTAGMGAIVKPFAIGNYAVGFDVDPGSNIWNASGTAFGYLELDYDVTVGGGGNAITAGVLDASFHEAFNGGGFVSSDGSVSTANGGLTATVTCDNTIDPGGCNNEAEPVRNFVCGA